MKKRLLSILLLGSVILTMSACKNFEIVSLTGDIVSGTVVEGAAATGNAVSSRAVSGSESGLHGEAKEDTAAGNGYTALEKGNSTNCYTEYDYEEDKEKEFDASTDILQFDRNEKVSAAIDTGIDDITILKVTEKAIYCDYYSDRKEYVIYRIPIQKTAENDIVLVDEKKGIIVDDDREEFSRYVTYLDDDCIVYQMCKLNGEEDYTDTHWYRYDWQTEKTTEVKGAPDSFSCCMRVSGTGLINYSVRDSDSFGEIYYYYDAEKNTVRKANLGGVYYNYKTSFFCQTGKIVYFYPDEVYRSGYNGIPTLKRYDMETGQLEDAITKKDWIAFLKKQKLWESGLSVYVRGITEGEGRLYFEVSVDQQDKKKVWRYKDIVVSCLAYQESDMRYETKINDRLRNKGDKKPFTDKYGETFRFENAVPVLYYPYVVILGAKNEIYNIRKDKKVKINAKKANDFGYQLSEWGF